jgi:ABC-2 type transport system permease protein
MLMEQTRSEFLRLWRSPIFSIFSLALPVMFFLFFGTQHVTREIVPGVTVGGYILASLGAYAVANVMLFTFGISVAVERGRKMDLLMRATPGRAIAPLVAKTVAGLVFGVLALALLFAVAYLVGVRLEPKAWFTLAGRLLLGSLPFLMLGFALGYISSPNAAPAVVNLVGLPMYFASGIFIPVSQLPEFIQKVAPYLPTYRYGQLAWSAVGFPTTDSLQVNVIWLVGFTLAFLIVAIWAYRLDDSRKFS